MKIVLPGGTGHIGRLLSRALAAAGHDVVVLSRQDRARPGVVRWDGRTVGAWAAELDGCDAVINLAGRSVNCRYNDRNVRAMMDSRVDSTRAVGEAIRRASAPPRVWLQMSTATIYAHRSDAANDEATGIIGGDETDVPGYWAFSVDIAKAWEQAQQEAITPHTRKVTLRTAMVMSPERGGAFDMLRRMVRLGLGGPVAGGGQFMSWIHDEDLVRSVEFLMDNEDMTGPVNLAAPSPVPYGDFMRALRAACGIPIGLPATRWMAEIGAFVLRSDTELLLKSRRVTPGRLVDAGFAFQFTDWPDAARDLVHRTRNTGRVPAPTR
nr:TIGR01777 family oxidoreductase [Kibdelosporangium sp. MJ126-NF4]CEL23070.1 Cell division inhibitor [Kibdelosporangium sp. MJ126-NF4]CTQ90208.1 Cell division inhibitor [Kibdelosporangium sp. MJ126-NF4]